MVKKKSPPKLQPITRLGRITSAEFGTTVDNKIGITLHVAGEGWGIFIADVTYNYAALKDKETPTWETESRRIECETIIDTISFILRDAKKTTLDQLVGVPIEATTTGSTLNTWRVLQEVL
jgi:hypothetical protein